MKYTVRSILVIFLIPLLTHCNKEPDHAGITDNVFLKKLINLGIDINADGLIGLDEAAKVTSLNLLPNMSEESITSLAGIEAFINLHELELLPLSGQ